jgi:hypothetical protein
VLHANLVKLLSVDTPLLPRIADDPKYTPYFNDCISALDGTYILAHILTKDQARYRNRKGTAPQNVLAVCSFNIRFLYLLPG